MKIRVWGCRGSLAAPGADTLRYGGNTSCVEVRGDHGEVLVLDAGTGMRPLGVAIHDDGAARIDILLSHLHLDHLQGLGFFRPLFDSGREVHIWGPASPVQSLADRISMYLSPPLFPVRLADIPARLEFHDAPEEPIAIGSLTVRASLVTHQGPTVGYRIEDRGRSLVYLPDHEPGIAGDLSGRPVEWVSGYHLAHRADVLLHDAQYGDGEYPQHVGWGHSAIAHVVDFARMADVERLVLFHHDPYHTDDDLELLVTDAQNCWGAECERVEAAREGMTITFAEDGVSIDPAGGRATSSS
jgi:phosphoribosyl 1,2-cyclic phosphodiesterase